MYDDWDIWDDEHASELGNDWEQAIEACGMFEHHKRWICADGGTEHCGFFCPFSFMIGDPVTNQEND